jgi:hypothetical protein
MGRSKRKHQTSHQGMKNHFLFPGLLHPFHRLTSGLRVVGNIIHIRQSRLRRKRISVRRRAEMGKARVDRHFLFRGMQGLVSIDDSEHSIAFSMYSLFQCVPAALRDPLLELLHRPPHCLHFVSHLFHHECTYCLAYDYELICVEPAVHLHIFMLYVYYTIYTLLIKLLSDRSLYSSSGGRSSNLIVSDWPHQQEENSPLKDLTSGNRSF